MGSQCGEPLRWAEIQVQSCWYSKERLSFQGCPRRWEEVCPQWEKEGKGPATWREDPGRESWLRKHSLSWEWSRGILELECLIFSSQFSWELLGGWYEAPWLSPNHQSSWPHTSPCVSGWFGEIKGRQPAQHLVITEGNSQSPSWECSVSILGSPEEHRWEGRWTAQSHTHGDIGVTFQPLSMAPAAQHLEPILALPQEKPWHLTEEEPEVQRRRGTCLRPHSKFWVKLSGLAMGSLGSPAPMDAHRLLDTSL